MIPYLPRSIGAYICSQANTLRIFTMRLSFRTFARLHLLYLLSILQLLELGLSSGNVSTMGAFHLYLADRDEKIEERHVGHA